MEGSGRPITKVVNLLKGMQEQLEKEGKDDEDQNDKLTCWCDKNEEDMTKTITESDETIETQTASVKQNTALDARLKQEIRQLTKEINANQNTIETAKVLRADQVKAFEKREDAIIENLDAVSKAYTTLSNSFLQTPEDLRSIARLKKFVDSNYNNLREKNTRADMMMLEEFLKEPSRFGKGGSAFLQRQGEEVGISDDTIIGILKTMKDDFTADLKEARDEDLKLQTSYQELLDAKNKEVKAGQVQKETKEEQKAEAVQKVITGKQDIKAATASKADAETYLATVRAKCKESKAEYNERMTMRQEEMTAVNKAVEVLDADDAHATFKRALSLLQESEDSSSSPREERAAEVLSAAGKHTGKQALITLGMKAKSVGLTKVLKAMEDMYAALKQEQKDEIAQKDECIKDLDANDASTASNTQSKGGLEVRVQELESDISEKTQEISLLQADVDEMNEQKKASTVNREKEHSEFQAVIADQKTTQRLLTKAMGVLKAFYEKEEEAKLVQIGVHSQVETDKPAALGDYKKSTGGTGVITLLQQIKEDSQRMQHEAEEAEKSSLKAYNELMADTDAAIASKTKDISHKNGKKSGFEAELSQTKQNLRGTKDELANLAKTNYALHEECDFVMKNFELRQRTRMTEMKALQEAKVILTVP
eukprot:TRINITY_DN51293_c0_g1_i1.p1 TRINITY_DN51293_c0_g1~~TRINITY_DN51293_c0_g1_i1.p1  ORF type:complete len:698 (+),score=241.31 TRINITY_DN51293_c0_g1_i1:135-2096(+)